jgi:hypothetical protein
MSSSVASSTARPAAVAGSFYPASPKVLQRTVDDMLQSAEVPKSSGSILGLVSPHAGYVYSGFTAAHSYKMLSGMTPEAVIVVGPSHRDYFDGVSIFPGASYQTPLGEVPIHASLRAELLAAGKIITLSPLGHGAEHCIEVQLPFLQRALGSFSFVPVIMGDQSLDICRKLAEALASVIGKRNIILVASSDLSHYHPYDEAVKLDKRVIRLVEEYDPVGLLDKLEHHQLEACGGGPIAAVMLAAQKLGASKASVLHYCNSGDTAGDKDAVVGYLSAMFTREFTPKAH